MENETSNNPQTANGIKSNVKRSFMPHRFVKVFGGRYYEAKTDTLYWYRGEVNLWFIGKWYDAKKWFLLKYYSIQIWWLKRKERKKL